MLIDVLSIVGSFIAWLIFHRIVREAFSSDESERERRRHAARSAHDKYTAAYVDGHISLAEYEQQLETIDLEEIE
jgi:hypothetical protein